MSAALNMDLRVVAEECTRAAEEETMTFPQILGRLAEVGVEGYYCDLRRESKTYYTPEGDAVEVKARGVDAPIAAAFDAGMVASAVGQSQRLEHTYREFCEKVRAAGCQGYLVSLLGRRAVYFGRTGETHVEYFPGSR